MRVPPLAESWISSVSPSSYCFDLLEHRQDIAAELLGVLRHRKVPEPFHDLDLRPLDGGCGSQRVLGRAGEAVFAGEQKQRTGRGVDRADPRPQVAVDPIEVEVAFEHAGSALHIMPERLAPPCVGPAGRDEPRNKGRADLTAMDIWPVQPARIVPGRLEVGRLETDQGAEL